jgi:cell division protease FtsH
MVQYGDNNEYVFLGREMSRSKDYSEQTAREIDGEVRGLIDEAYRRAQRIIEEHRDQLELLAQALLDHETLDGPQVEEIIRTGTFTPPPSGDDGSAKVTAGDEIAATGSKRSTPPPLDSGLGQPAPAPV